MILIGKCKVCGKEFEYPHWREGKASYCSIKCQNMSLRAKNNVKCEVCGKEFHLKPYAIKKRKVKKFFCSYKCLAEYKRVAFRGENNHQYGLKGDKNASFKGNEITRKNNRNIDVRVYMPQHPFCDKNGRVVKHRLVVEENHFLFDEKYFDKINGFVVLKKEYNVHHKDGNHSNNDISNLQILTRSEHTSIHNKGRIIIRDKLGRITAVVKQGELLGNHKTNALLQPQARQERQT